MSRLALIMLLTSVAQPWTTASEQPGHFQASAQEPDWHQALDSGAPIGFFIAPEDGEASAARAGDAQLARWALRAWEQAAEGRFELVPAAQEHSLIRLRWVAGVEALYGEMRPFLLGGKRGAAVFVLPDSSGLGQEIHRLAQRDPLFRDTLVYLTCLHELGHAFGLGHTAAYEDIMYSFQYGGDIVGYFRRYRDRIRTRDDIAQVAGFSQQDIARLRAMYDRAR